MVSSPVAKRSRSEEPTGIPELGVLFPKVLLPDSAKVDLRKWAVVACDQYTSEEDYWKRVEDLVGESPSTLRLTFPEVYLDKGKDDEIISGINAAMKTYEAEGYFKETPNHGVVVVERTLRSGVLRKGIVLALDLERYSFKADSGSLIRATEKTIEARIPPRLKVRHDARMELPHIIVLIDDAEDKVISSLADFCDDQTCVYETELMENSGYLKGFFIDSPLALAKLTSALHAIADPAAFKQQYGDAPQMVFAMGDGNHSLATAKTLWERTKSEAADLDELLLTSPARYALVELQNCQDPTLVFEPIHRLITEVAGGAGQFLTDVKSFFDARGEGPVEVCEGEDEYLDVLADAATGHSVGFVLEGKKGVITIPHAKKVLPVASLTDFIDSWLAERDAKIDYVHETTAIDRFCVSGEAGNIGIVFSSMPKSDLFKTVVTDGALPRKTFSMGNAHDKRFYFEARYIQ